MVLKVKVFILGLKIVFEHTVQHRNGLFAAHLCELTGQASVDLFMHSQINRCVTIQTFPMKQKPKAHLAALWPSCSTR